MGGGVRGGAAQIHETYGRDEELKGSSDRSFGFVFVALFLLIAFGRLVHGGEPRWWALVIAVVLAAIAVIRPGLLHPFNRAWFYFGLALHHVVSPIVMGLMFYLVISPMGTLMRVRGRDALLSKRDSAVRSYWIIRDPPGPAPITMTRQF
jgi:hypothetical protein